MVTFTGNCRTSFGDAWRLVDTRSCQYVQEFRGGSRYRREVQARLTRQTKEEVPNRCIYIVTSSAELRTTISDMYHLITSAFTGVKWPMLLASWIRVASFSDDGGDKAEKTPTSQRVINTPIIIRRGKDTVRLIDLSTRFAFKIQQFVTKHEHSRGRLSCSLVRNYARDLLSSPQQA